MFKISKIILLVFFILSVLSLSIFFLFNNEILETLRVIKFYKTRNISNKSYKYSVNTVLYDLKLTKRSIKSVVPDYNFKKKNTPIGYLESFENNLYFISTYGTFFKVVNFDNLKLKKIPTNFDIITKHENFIKTMAIRDLYFDEINNTIYISYVYNSEKKKCTGLSLISGKFNNFKDIIFKENFKTKCIQYKSTNDFNEMSSGGKIISFNEEKIILTVGDFWQGSIAQDLDEPYGKTLLLNKNDFSSEIYTLGHRNQQGITKINETIFTSEHGPRGGDEINLLVKNENYGWPIVSYGPDYKKNYEKYYLNDHQNFKEPFFVFAPSIAISDIEFYNSDLFERWKGSLLVASMRNNTGIISLLNPGLSLYRLKFDKNFKKILYSEKIFINDRIRDIEILDNGLIFFLTEEQPAIVKIDKLR